MLTDEFFRVEGSDGSIFVMGDAATIHTPLASEHVDELFESWDTDKDGLLTVGQLQKLLHDSEKDFPHLAKHARFLDGKQNRCVFAAEVTAWLWHPEGRATLTHHHCPVCMWLPCATSQQASPQAEPVYEVADTP